jgi:hypothetical protein
MIAERDRLLGATRKTWELERAVKARAAASRRVAEIAVAMAGSGNVVQFPTTLHYHMSGAWLAVLAALASLFKCVQRRPLG